jgi:hypothetical protein
VDDAFFVSGGEGVGQGCGDFEDLCGGKAAGRNVAIEGFSFDQFHS